MQADGNWETLEYGKAAVSGEYIVEEEPDEDRPGGVTRYPSRQERQTDIESDRWIGYE